jgi:hypothetical protein
LIAVVRNESRAAEYAPSQVGARSNFYVEATPKSSFEAAIAKMIIEIPAHGEARRIHFTRV